MAFGLLDSIGIIWDHVERALEAVESTAAALG
jgi:hypothetical protein